MVRRTFGAVGAFAAVVALGGTATAGAVGGAELGPEGYRTLQLGQSEQQAVATGLLVDRQQPGDCVFYRLRSEEGQANPGSGVFIDPRLGVVMIGGTDRIRTPGGIGYGSTLAEVRATYPDLEPEGPTGFVHEADVPGHHANEYRFAFGPDDRVTDFGLEGPELGVCDSDGPDTEDVDPHDIDTDDLHDDD
ncbi:hypothetical protein [Saccharopolyspora cebuensis]|uniref:Secreted protein n=1 Tax=Saccharopolyspora cebuensis TaxID=418759 RepID=A0ABV4CH41_9PSEU